MFAPNTEAQPTWDASSLKKKLAVTNDVKSLQRMLDSLGRLPPDFDASLLLPLLEHPSATIRLLAVKNIGKTKDPTYFSAMRDAAARENNSLVRREAVSTIGRMRTKRAIPSLIEFLQDEDAKVVLQAVRALMPFRLLPDVREALLQLTNHPNELVREAANSTKKSEASDLKHAQSPDYLKNLFINADVRALLPRLPDESIHLTFTSPPYYNARDYTIYKSYEEYLQFLVHIFREVHRITKEGRFFVLNTSPVIVPRMSRAHASRRYLIPFDIHPRLTAIGWEFIEDIVWLKPDPSAKNRNGSFFQHRKPLGYKANSVSEYVLVYRKKTDKLIDWNMRQYEDEIINASKVRGDYEKTNVWKIAPSNDKIHPATFPKALAARVIEFYSFKGDLIFDPFAGIGTVGQAATMLDRYYLLAEQEEKYSNRAKELMSGQRLFDNFAPKFCSLAEFENRDRFQ